MAETHGKQNGKFRSSLFKGLQVEGSALVALRRARNTLAAIPRAGGELKKAPVGLFLRVILVLLLKLTNIVPTPVNQDRTNYFYESKRARASGVPPQSIRAGRCASGSALGTRR